MKLKQQYLFSFILALCLSLFACQQSNEQQASDSANQADAKEEQVASNEPTKRNDMKIVEPEGEQMGVAILPNDNAIELIKGSMEESLSKALLSGEPIDQKKFVFDAVKFTPDNTAIDKDASVFQTYNFAALIEAFPKKNWVVSSVVVDSEDSGKNLEDAEKQIELFRNYLEETGIDVGSIEFIPLGSEASELSHEGEEQKSGLILQVR